MKSPYIVVEVRTPHCTGRLVIDHLVGGIAMGGIRVATSVPTSLVMELARDMTMKCALVGLRCGGSKCGVEVPAGGDRELALTEFMRAIAPYLRDHCLAGSDVGTTLEEVNSRIRDLGLWSARKRLAETFTGVSIEQFLQLVGSKIDGVEVGVMRNGWGVQGAARAFFEHEFGRSLEGATVAVQGFGKMGAGSAFALSHAGAKIMAVSDVGGTIRSDAPLRVMELWNARFTSGLLEPKPSVDDDILFGDEDILVLGAVENAITLDQASRVRAKLVVCGANLAMNPATMEALEKRGIAVVPSVLGSLGTAGSLRFAAGTAEDLRDQLERHIYDVCRHVLVRADSDRATTLQAAETVAAERLAALETI
jgi:glutamate dehydrogenase (NAD(P)+)